MKNPFLKMYDPKEGMIKKARAWKPFARTGKPQLSDYPILIWLAGYSPGWQVWYSPQISESEAFQEGRFVWFTLPKED